MATKKLIIIKGKGTKKEKRIKTDIVLYWSDKLGQWVTVVGSE